MKLSDSQEAADNGLWRAEAEYLIAFGWRPVDNGGLGVTVWRDPNDCTETQLHDQAVATQKARVVDITQRR